MIHFNERKKTISNRISPANWINCIELHNIFLKLGALKIQWRRLVNFFLWVWTRSVFVSNWNVRSKFCFVRKPIGIPHIICVCVSESVLCALCAWLECGHRIAPRHATAFQTNSHDARTHFCSARVAMTHRCEWIYLYYFACTQNAWLYFVCWLHLHCNAHWHMILKMSIKVLFTIITLCTDAQTVWPWNETHVTCAHCLCVCVCVQVRTTCDAHMHRASIEIDSLFF